MGADTKICLEIIHKRKVSLLPSGPGQVGSPGDEVILSELQYSQLIGCDGRRAAGDLAVRRVRDPGGADHAADPLPAPHPVPHRPGRGHAHRGRSAPPPATRLPRQVAAPSQNIVC